VHEYPAVVSSQQFCRARPRFAAHRRVWSGRGSWRDTEHWGGGHFAGAAARACVRCSLSPSRSARDSRMEPNTSATVSKSLSTAKTTSGWLALTRVPSTVYWPPCNKGQDQVQRQAPGSGSAMPYHPFSRKNTAQHVQDLGRLRFSEPHSCRRGDNGKDSRGTTETRTRFDQQWYVLLRHACEADALCKSALTQR